jgi:hypothetical protein
MIIQCEKCGETYNDETRSTMCDHGLIGSEGKYAYCRHHDLFNCPLHDDSPYSQDAYGIIKEQECRKKP